MYLSVVSVGSTGLCPIKQYKSKREQAKANREQELLDIALTMMQEDGFSGLTMDGIVARCDYSKGTVYNHFNSKEDLMCALCIKGTRDCLRLFQRGKMFPGNSREKMLVVYYGYWVHALCSPTLFLAILTAQTPSIKEKASTERLAIQADLDREIKQMCDSFIQDAIACGDLKVGPGLGVAQLTFASWGMAFGTNALLSVDDIPSIDRLQRGNTPLLNASLLMDGMGWTPLSSEWDYQATWKKIEKEVFSEELSYLRSSLGL